MVRRHAFSASKQRRRRGRECCRMQKRKNALCVSAVCVQREGVATTQRARDAVWETAPPLKQSDPSTTRSQTPSKTAQQTGTINSLEEAVVQTRVLQDNSSSKTEYATTHEEIATRHAGNTNA